MRRYFYFSLILLFLASCLGHEQAFVRSLTAPSFADWIFLNGKIISLDKDSSVQEAIAVTDGVIVAVGSDGEMRRWRGPRTREINLAGHSVIPGLNDPHIHATAAALKGDPELHPFENARPSLRSFFRQLNRVGVTSVGDVHTEKVSFAHRRLLNDMARAGELTLRVSFYFAPERNVEQLEQFNRAVAEAKQLRQTDMFRFAGFADILAPGHDELAAPAHDKALSTAAKEMLRRALQFFAAGDHNFQVHAAHDQRGRQLLDVIEAVNRETSLARLRIGFTALEDASPETIQRVKKLGAGVVVRIRHVQPWRGQRILSAPALRTLAGAGVPLGAGSGAIRADEYSPMLALRWLITAKSGTGTAMRGPAQNLTRMEALRAYTLGGAWFTADEHRKGSIEVGKLADLVVLNGDYLNAPLDRIPALESLLTMAGGRIVYAAGPFARFEMP